MSMDSDEKYIGFVKYSGELVEDGIMGAVTSAEALLGLDKIFKFLLVKENPGFKGMDFDIPVAIKKGSWGMLIPDAIDHMYNFKSIADSLGCLYATTTVAIGATKGFEETGFAKNSKSLMKIAIKGTILTMQWIAKIANHMGVFEKITLEKPIFEQKGSDIFIKLENDFGEILDVPQKYFQLFNECPSDLFAKNAKIIQNGRILEFGLFGEGETVSITAKERAIFYTPNDDILFPELVHGQSVQLEGDITKINVNRKNIGIDYKGHILLCFPKSGRSIEAYKDKIVSPEPGHLLTKIKIFGVVDRKYKKPEITEKRPRIIFIDIVPIISTSAQESLNFE
ncbi:MAG: hypothetical protein Q7V63_06305 [Gammaproteobacteria bacterium]|nr:hypothetical protein [Gammaproteobacteria bacterium]